MRWPVSSFLVFALQALLCSPVTAVFADDAFKVDYHLALLGLPRAHSTFFHRPDPQSKGSLLYTLSERNVLGAVNPRDGNLVWRQVLEDTTANITTASPGVVRFEDGQDAVVSAVAGTVAAWSAMDGRLIWSHQLKQSEFAVSAEVLHDGDVVALSSDGQVSRLSATDGSLKWSYTDSSGDKPHALSVSKDQIFYLSISSTLLKGYKVKVTSLNPQSGVKIEQTTLSTDSDLGSPADILYVSGSSQVPVIAWTDQARSIVKANVLGTKGITSVNVEKTGQEIEALTVHVPQGNLCATQLLVRYQTADRHWADVLTVNDARSAIAKSYAIGSSQGPGAFTASCSDGQVYFTEVTPSELKLYSSHGMLIGFPIPGQISTHVPGISPGDDSAVAVASDVLVKQGNSYAVRAAVLLSSGDWILIQNGQVSWTRHESLASIVQADFAILVDDKTLQQHVSLDVHSNPVSAYIYRLKNHVSDLFTLLERINVFVNSPVWLSDLFTDVFSTKSSKTNPFETDKLAILETANGRIIALRLRDFGKILWNSKIQAGGDNPQASIVQNTRPSWWSLTNNHKLSLTFESPEAVVAAAAVTSEETVYEISNGVLAGKKDGKEMWRFNPLPGHRVVSTHSAKPVEPIASIGKALADRSVLYKYLNKNSIIAVSLDEKKYRASITLLDAVSGEVLYVTTHDNVDVARPISMVVSENWFAYSLTTTSPDANSHGHLLVMTELYESSIPNDRGPLGSNNQFNSSGPQVGASRAHKPHAIAQIFHVPEEISSLAVTQTSQGITSRQLLAVLAGSGSIVGIPRQALDPRRVVGKAPSSAQQMEEDLSQYHPVIDFDPKWHLTHSRDVIGITHVMTTSTQMESTGIVFAYGLDVFGTKVAPSGTFDILGASFNKIQLVLTVLGLFVGVVGVKPLVGRKQTNALWQA